VVKVVAMVAIAACSSGKPKAVEDGAHVGTSPSPSPSPSPISTTNSGSGSGSGSGDLQVRVEWHDVPVVARASPGRTACGTARAASVAPTTTWGIPEAFVVIAGDRAKPAAEPGARVVYDHCALGPRAIVAGAALAVGSTADAPVQLGLARRGSVRELGTVGTDAPKPLQLPIAGHQVDVALDADGVYELTAADTSAWIISAPGAYAAVTDPAGHAAVRALPAGHYAITAWLPPRAGQPARVAHGEANVTAGALAEVTLDLGR
jgi:hypothetical protein